MAEYIEREAALREIERCEKFMVGDKTITTDAMKTFIKNRPAVDVAPVVHGRFIETERPIRDGKSKVYGWECTACKRFTRSPFVDSWQFCPNCGAKMDGRDEDAVD